MKIKKIAKGFVKFAGLTTGTGIIAYSCFDLLPENQFKYDILGVIKHETQIIYAAYIAYLSYKDYKYNVLPLQEGELYRTELRQFHIRTAERIYVLCIRAKGLYIKFGQYISTLDRVIPKEVADVLKQLQDSCPPQPLSTMKIVLDENIPKWRESIFDLEPEPIGSASLAQVHKARLADGKTVAVKMQYPELRLQFDMDLKSLAFLARQLTNLLRTMNILTIDFEYIFKKFRQSVQNEMDFENEVENSKIMKEFLENNDDVVVPGVRSDLSSKRVITMDYITGVRSDEKQKIEDKLKLNPQDVGNLLVDLYLAMIFKLGYIHCDPHPGNILVRCHPKKQGKPQIVLLDHGFYRHLSDEVRDNFAKLWMALINRDERKVRSLASWFGIEKKVNYLSLIFLFRTKNVMRIGDSFTTEEVNRLRNKEILSLSNVADMLEEFPEDILMIIRTMNMISMRNIGLGNSNRDRIIKTTRMVYQTQFKNQLFWKAAYFWFRVKLFIFERFWHLFQVFQSDNALEL